MALTELAGAASSSPQLPEFSRHTRLLVVAPHPDDETIATGLLIQRVLVAGGHVQILLLTLGDNNPWPQRWLERRLQIGVDDRLRWGERRQQEMLAAMHRLGLPATALQCMGWPDLGITRLLLDDPDRLRAAVGDVITRFQPTLLVFPALEDRHPDHSAAHVAVRLALAGLAARPAWFCYLLHGRVGSRPRLEISGSGEQLACKLAALDQHRSQMALSRGRMQRMASRAETFAGARVELRSGLPWQPPVWLRSVLRLSVVSRDGVVSWPWAEAPLACGAADFRPTPSELADRDARFVRLASTLPSPWIFDRWGWCELASANDGLA
jgi:N-acetyl-1-D-myo-inositol-2-amino-2-deoxy-alpha-D-glucopyranoside deacetylase